MATRYVVATGFQRQMRGHLYVDLIPGYCRMPRTLHLRLSVTEKEPMTTQELYAAIDNVVTWLDHVSPRFPGQCVNVFLKNKNRGCCMLA